MMKQLPRMSSKKALGELWDLVEANLDLLERFIDDKNRIKLSLKGYYYDES